jgi:peptide-methionine (S)-S-oxide reductase
MSQLSNNPDRPSRFWHPGSLLIMTALLLAAGMGFTVLRSTADVAPHSVPAPDVDLPAASGATSAVAVLAGGCFWGVQGVFQHVKGVTNAVSGYAGGDKRSAIYEVVATGQTGHAETVQVTYDPRQISYGQLLQIYFSVAHDPTELNRQGPDVGTQYRSAIFPKDAEQARIARTYIAQLNRARVFDAAIVTKIEPGKDFYPAEGYHQDFLTKHPTYPYIVINDIPKVEALKRLFPKLYRDDPVLVASAKTN